MKSLILILPFCILLSLSQVVQADYKILVDPDQGGKVIAAGWPGTVWTPVGNQYVVSDLLGDIPSGINWYKYVDGQLINTYTGQHLLFVADDDEIQANGSSWTTIRVTLTDSNGDPIDDDATTVNFVSTRGLLSSSQQTLENGTASVTLTSASENVTSQIRVSTGVITGTVITLDAECEVSFVP